MKNAGRIILIIALIITALPVFSGCGEKAGTEVTPVKEACIEMMQKVPVYYDYFEFWNVATLRTDPDLADMYKIWYERHDVSAHLKIDGDKINYLAESDMTLVKGDFNLNDISKEFDNNYVRDNNYLDADVWSFSTGEAPNTVRWSVTIAEGLIIRCNTYNINDLLKVSGGEELSMYDKNAAALLEKLPDGIMSRVIRSNYPEGLILSGDSVRKEEKSVFKWTNVCKFESPDATQSNEVKQYFQGIEDEFKEVETFYQERDESCPFHAFTLEYDGEYVIWSVMVDGQAMIGMLFYG